MMHKIRTPHARTAFTLVELLVVIAIIALLVSILLPSLAQARGAARKAKCESGMKQLAVAVATYAVDYQDRMASFSWKPYLRNVDWAPVPQSPLEAANHQAYDIIRRRSGRLDINAESLPNGWIPHVLYSHLVLNEYLQHRLPEPLVACPEDRPRGEWQLDPVNAERMPSYPNSPDRIRWPYSSSYSFVSSFWSRDRSPTVAQGGSHNTYDTGGDFTGQTFGLRRLTEVNFPAQKVMLYDIQARHGKKPMYFGYSDAVQPLAFMDSSVRTYRTGDGNKGFRPNAPRSADPTVYNYDPDLNFESPTRSGDDTEEVVGYFRWTRGGLKGVDFGGTEISTGQP